MSYRRQLLIDFCPECQACLVRTPNGACCPNGHGRIQPLSFVPAGSFPAATRIGSSRRYLLAGVPGQWRTAVSRPSLSGWAPKRSARRRAEVRGDDWRIGRLGRRLMWFAPAPVTVPGRKT